jgi:hypothetical protein
MQSKFLKVSLTFLVSMMFSCTKNPSNDPETNNYKPTPYTLQIPAGFPEYNVQPMVEVVILVISRKIRIQFQFIMQKMDLKLVCLHM